MLKRAEDRYSFCYSVTVFLLQMALIGLRTVTVSVTVSPSFPCLIGLRTVQVLLQCRSFSFIHDLKRAEDHYSFCYSFSLFPLFNWVEDPYSFCYSVCFFHVSHRAEDRLQGRVSLSNLYLANSAIHYLDSVDLCEAMIAFVPVH